MPVGRNYEENHYRFGKMSTSIEIGKSIALAGNRATRLNIDEISEKWSRWTKEQARAEICKVVVNNWELEIINYGIVHANWLLKTTAVLIVKILRRPLKQQ